MPDPIHRDLSDRPRGPDQWQDVTNEAWPPLGVARTLRDVPLDRQLEVVARLVFAVDGEQYLPGRALRWTRTNVCVMVSSVEMGARRISFTDAIGLCRALEIDLRELLRGADSDVFEVLGIDRRGDS